MIFNVWYVLIRLALTIVAIPLISTIGSTAAISIFLGLVTFQSLLNWLLLFKSWFDIGLNVFYDISLITVGVILLLEELDFFSSS